MSSSVFTAHARTNLPSRGIGGGVVEVEGNTALAFQENGERFHDTAMERIVELKYYYKLLYPVVYTYQCTMLRAGYPYTIREVYRDRNGCNTVKYKFRLHYFFHRKSKYACALQRERKKLPDINRK